MRLADCTSMCFYCVFINDDVFNCGVRSVFIWNAYMLLLRLAKMFSTGWQRQGAMDAKTLTHRQIMTQHICGCVSAYVGFEVCAKINKMYVETNHT